MSGKKEPVQLKIAKQSGQAIVGGQSVTNCTEYSTSCNKNQTGKIAKMKKIAKFAFRLAKGILFLPAYIANPAFGLTDAEKEEMGIKINR